MYCQKAIDSYKNYYDNEIHEKLGDFYVAMGNIYERQKSYETALSWYQKAFEIYHKLGMDNQNRFFALELCIAGCAFSLGDYAEVEYFLNEVCRKANELDYKETESTAYYMLGMLYKTSEYFNLEKSIECFKKSFDVSKNNSFYKSDSDNAMKLFYLASSDSVFVNQIDFIKELISFTVSMRELAICDLSSLKFNLLRDILPVYYYGVGFEAENGNLEKGFEYSERLRSRSFLDQVGKERALSLDGITDSEWNRINEYITQISIARKEIEEECNKSILERNNKKLSDSENNLSNAEKQLAKLDSEIGKRIPAYSALRNPQIVKAKDAQKWCGKDKAIIEYVIWNPKILDEVEYLKNSNVRKSAENIKFGSYCIVITNKKIAVVPLDVDYDYAASVSKLREGIIPKRISPQPETVFEDVRNELYEKLIEPVLPYVKSKNNLVVVPDGSLAFLPFDVLRKDENSKMLCEQFAISLSPFVSVSMVSKSSNSNLNKMLAFGGAWYDSSLSSDEHRRTFSLEDKDRGGKRGAQSLETEMLIENQQQKEAIIQDIKLNGPSSYFEKKNLHWKDLPGTLTELNCLQKIFKSKDFSEFVQENASENKLKELSKNGELKKISILHFACHGYFDRQISDMSSILFSEVSGKLSDFSSNDGYLTIPEVSTLNLNADIVCLSACETGLGEVKFGDGMTGLSRAFMVAGARHVGVTLWSVDDEATSEFMSRMYKKISGGKTYEQAYRQTKNELIKTRDYNHPYYWAPFVLYE